LAVALGPVVLNPFGMRWTVSVTLDHGPAPDPPVVAVTPPPTRPTTPGWYRGDLHLHTTHSDGVPGQEVTTRHGHWLAVGLPERPVVTRRRGVIAESSGVVLTRTVDGAGPGEETTVPATVRAEVSGAPDTVLTLRTGTGTVATAPVDSQGRQVLSWVVRDPTARYARAELRRRGGSLRGRMVALSNPVWLCAAPSRSPAPAAA
jgi:hypothetical protein